MIGIVCLLIMIFLIHYGISNEEYCNAYFGIYILTLSFWGGLKIKLDWNSRYHPGRLPDALFIIFLSIWVIMGADYELEKNFEGFIGSYIIAVLAYIACVFVNADKPKTEKYISGEKSHYYTNNTTTNKEVIKPIIEQSKITIPTSFENEDNGRATSNAESNIHNIVKLQNSKVKHLIEKRMKEDPVVQYNLQLIEDKKIELEERIKAYNAFKSQKDDETIISISTNGMIDIEELNEKLKELRDEIEDLKNDIVYLKEENKNIREELKEDIEDEMWEKDFNL